MNEAEFKSRIKAAFPREDVPSGLMERTIQRGRAIEMGREAEKALAAGKGTEQDVSVAAAGRLMLLKDAPKGMKAEDIAKALADQPGFKDFSRKSFDSQLESLKNGKFLSEITTAKNEAKEKAPETPKIEKLPTL